MKQTREEVGELRERLARRLTQKTAILKLKVNDENREIVLEALALGEAALAEGLADLNEEFYGEWIIDYDIVLIGGYRVLVESIEG